MMPETEIDYDVVLAEDGMRAFIAFDAFSNTAADLTGWRLDGRDLVFETKAGCYVLKDLPSDILLFWKQHGALHLFGFDDQAQIRIHFRFPYRPPDSD